MIIRLIYLIMCVSFHAHDLLGLLNKREKKLDDVMEDLKKELFIGSKLRKK